MKQPVTIFWFRRDLRLNDNVGLYEALRGDHTVLPIFIFDSDILEKLPEDDARVTFIHDTLQNIQSTLKEEHNSSIAMFHGKPIDIFKHLVDSYDIGAVYTNHDYEPYAKARDEKVASFLNENHIEFKTFKDQVVFEKSEIVKKRWQTLYGLYAIYETLEGYI